MLSVGSASGERRDDWVLILASQPAEALALRDTLAADGLVCRECPDLTSLGREIARGAGVAIVAERRLDDAGDRLLALAIRSEPAWSDFPVIVLADDAPRDGSARLDPALNATLVPRAAPPRFLRSAVQAALRSRRHQHAIRAAIAARDHQTSALLDSQSRLRFALAAARLGSWELDLATNWLESSDICKANFGRPGDAPFTYAEFYESVHADDRDAVTTAIARALEERVDYEAEYRVHWPSGELRWIFARGRATYHDDGTPIRLSGVTLDVTDRRRAEAALREADRRKDEFLALLAHELRNPLAPLRNGLQMLRMGDELDAESAAYVVGMMDRQLAHMVRLIDDLLDVARIGRGKLELRRSRVLVSDVLASAAEAARPLLAAGELRFHMRHPEEPLALDGDLVRLAQVFGNLLANSAKFTPAGGRVELIAERRQSELVVQVIDDGVGISAEALPRIFEMFSQGDRTLERSSGGLGIGLALVKAIVGMHGGAVVAESPGVGRGATFTVRLPLMEADASASESGAVRAAPASIAARFLVVDDNADAADSTAMMLRMLGHHVVVAGDGLAAVELAERTRPDVILMDVGMPRLNGLDATRRIREFAWGRGLRIIALSGWGLEADRIRSQAAGCDGHLVKPVSLPDLEGLLAVLREANGTQSSSVSR